MNASIRLGPFDDCGRVNLVIETPQGSRSQYAYDAERQVFILKEIQPPGNTFPFDCGYVPGTRQRDGSPLTMLVLLDAPACVGCVVTCRPIGVLEAEPCRRERGEDERLIAVGTASRLYGAAKSLADLPPALLSEIEAFFTAHHAARGEAFHIRARSGPGRAEAILHASLTIPSSGK